MTTSDGFTAPAPAVALPAQPDWHARYSSERRKVRVLGGVLAAVVVLGLLAAMGAALAAVVAFGDRSGPAPMTRGSGQFGGQNFDGGPGPDQRPGPDMLGRQGQGQGQGQGPGQGRGQRGREGAAGQDTPGGRPDGLPGRGRVQGEQGTAGQVPAPPSTPAVP